MAAIGLQPNRSALRLVGHGLGVDVPSAMVASWAGHEGVVSVIVGESAVASDTEARSWRSTNIALELGRRRREDATATIAIGQTCVVRGVTSRCMATTTHLLWKGSTGPQA